MKKLLLIVFVGLGVVALGNFFFAGSSAQINSAGTNAVQPRIETPNDTFERLANSARVNGSARVIVGLKVAFKPEGELNRLQVGEQRDKIAAAQKGLLKRLNMNGVKRFATIPFLAAEVDLNALNALRKDVGVTTIEEDALNAPDLAESVPLIDVPAAWAAGYSGAGQAVAILDTGVDKNHPFLTGKVVSEACFSTNYAPINAVSTCPNNATSSTATDSGLYCDLSVTGCPHGTHVAGIAAGNGANAGVNFSGVAKDANIIAVKIFSKVTNQSACGSSTPCALSFDSDEIAALERVKELSATMNVAAVNMSLGGGRFYANCDGSKGAFKMAVDNLRSVGVATVISSGNNAYTDSISAPGCVSSAISVGSVNDGSLGTTADDISSFSNSATFLSLLAPGRYIYSSLPNNTYGNYSGTSMSAPHVAGAFAILKQRVPNASVSQIYNALAATGKPITDPRNNITKPRILVNAAMNSLTANGNCSFSFSPNSKTVLASGGSFNANFTANNSNCAWTATSNQTWITASGSGTGNGTINITVAPNNAAAATTRAGVVYINGEPFTINQTVPLAGSCATNTPIGFNQTVSDNLTTGNCVNNGYQYFAQYTFNGTAGQQIKISENSAIFDSYLYLADANSNILAEDDDSGGGTNSQIPGSGFYTLPATGAYIIRTTAFDGGSNGGPYTGAYSVTLTANNPTAANVSVNGRVTNAKGRGISRAYITLSDGGGATRYAVTNPFGYYRFFNVAAGATYLLNVNRKNYRFSQPSQTFSATRDGEINFVALP